MFQWTSNWTEDAYSVHKVHRIHQPLLMQSNLLRMQCLCCSSFIADTRRLIWGWAYLVQDGWHDRDTASDSGRTTGNACSVTGDSCDSTAGGWCGVMDENKRVQMVSFRVGAVGFVMAGCDRLHLILINVSLLMNFMIIGDNVVRCRFWLPVLDLMLSSHRPFRIHDSDHHLILSDRCCCLSVWDAFVAWFCWQKGDPKSLVVPFAYDILVGREGETACGRGKRSSSSSSSPGPGNWFKLTSEVTSFCSFLLDRRWEKSVSFSISPSPAWNVPSHSPTAPVSKWMQSLAACVSCECVRCPSRRYTTTASAAANRFLRSGRHTNAVWPKLFFPFLTFLRNSRNQQHHFHPHIPDHISPSHLLTAILSLATIFPHFVATLFQRWHPTSSKSVCISVEFHHTICHLSPVSIVQWQWSAGGKSSLVPRVSWIIHRVFTTSKKKSGSAKTSCSRSVSHSSLTSLSLYNQHHQLGLGFIFDDVYFRSTTTTTANTCIGC